MSGPALIKTHSYGKSDVRLMKVERHGALHYLKDLTISIQMSGAFQAAFCDGDNRLVVPTDTMKNTVYAFAGQKCMGEIEEFGMRLAGHFLQRHPHICRIQVHIFENLWKRISYEGSPQENSFQSAGAERREATVEGDHNGMTIKAAIQDLVMVKAARSAFENFLRDEYTTLKETRDRILGTTVKAEWSYLPPPENFREAWKTVRRVLLETFAAHDSHSVQHTLYAMGQAVLQQCDFVADIRLSMPNRHCLPVDLSPFHLENRNEVFVPIDEPSGLIEATLARPCA